MLTECPVRSAARNKQGNFQNVASRLFSAKCTRQVRSVTSARYPSIVIAVERIRESIKKVNEAGGKVLGEQMPLPGIGNYVSFFDTEGNRGSMLGPIPLGCYWFVSQ